MTSIMVCPHDGAECGSHGFCPDCTLSEFGAEPKPERRSRIRAWFELLGLAEWFFICWVVAVLFVAIGGAWSGWVGGK